MYNTFGNYLRVTTFGESHSKAVGAILDGVPPRISLTEDDIQPQLARRRPGQSQLSTPRNEMDAVSILSGVENGVTLGTPVSLLVHNKDQRPGDYKNTAAIPRPSHADYAYQKKYGITASSGGGRASARETIGRVAAGAIAEKILNLANDIEIVAWVSSIGTITSQKVDMGNISREMVDQYPTRCPDKQTSQMMEKALIEAKESSDSLGGTVSCVVRNVPAGLGEPVFGKLEALLAQAMLSIPATKGFEIGSGFEAARMSGSEHNDPFCLKNSRLGTVTNYSGGVQGGISNGEPIYFRIAFKPPPTIAKPQKTVDYEGNEVVFEAKGRHDPCVVYRAVPVVEAMTALVIGDLCLGQKSIQF
ncbi:Chorismate synthase [Chitinispirillum alkaliphilum]|nr:Chorismate synthase [Chitinispirillum alkaliphilum]